MSFEDVMPPNPRELDVIALLEDLPQHRLRRATWPLWWPS